MFMGAREGRNKRERGGGGGNSYKFYLWTQEVTVLFLFKIRIMFFLLSVLLPLLSHPLSSLFLPSISLTLAQPTHLYNLERSPLKPLCGALGLLSPLPTFCVDLLSKPVFYVMFPPLVLMAHLLLYCAHQKPDRRYLMST